jgi:hypothetical protein
MATPIRAKIMADPDTAFYLAVKQHLTTRPPYPARYRFVVPDVVRAYL